MSNQKCCGLDKDSEKKNPEKAGAQSCSCHETTASAALKIDESSCCGENSKPQWEESVKDDKRSHWIIGEIQTSVGMVPQISTELVFQDTVGSWKIRWGINRMNYKINSGLYGVGIPDENSPILVTANYKLSFDALRKELSGINAWILVLDTKGINVWCAAGKGTFSTQELLKQMRKNRVSEIVTHKKIILPQLGATGIMAHDVYLNSGFSVRYGPVRAKDLKGFIDAGMKATDEMRQVKFTLYDRVVLTPIELMGTVKQSLMIFGVMFLLNFIVKNPFSLIDVYAYLGAIMIGCVLTPVLLPFIPGKSFAWKGWVLGFVWAISLNLLKGWIEDPTNSFLRALSFVLILPAIASYYALNFTGSSTYTSFSGVQKEMKIVLPILVVSISSGIVLLLITSFVTF